MNRRRGRHDSQLKVFLSGLQYSFLAEEVVAYLKIPAELGLTLFLPYLLSLRMCTKCVLGLMFSYVWYVSRYKKYERIQILGNRVFITRILRATSNVKESKDILALFVITHERQSIHWDMLCVFLFFTTGRRGISCFPITLYKFPLIYYH